MNWKTFNLENLNCGDIGAAVKPYYCQSQMRWSFGDNLYLIEWWNIGMVVFVFLIVFLHIH